MMPIGMTIICLAFLENGIAGMKLRGSALALKDIENAVKSRDVSRDAASLKSRCRVKVGVARMG